MHAILDSKKLFTRCPRLNGNKNDVIQKRPTSVFQIIYPEFKINNYISVSFLYFSCSSFSCTVCCANYSSEAPTWDKQLFLADESVFHIFFAVKK